MRISDWSSDVCSSDLASTIRSCANCSPTSAGRSSPTVFRTMPICMPATFAPKAAARISRSASTTANPKRAGKPFISICQASTMRSEEHTSELQSLMRISYAVFCLKKNNKNKNYKETQTTEYTNTAENNKNQHDK